MASLNDDKAGHATLVDTPGSYWVVSGKIFLFLDPAGAVTTGSKPIIHTPPPSFRLSSAITQNASGANETLTYSIAATRQISITSTIQTSKGRQIATWSQSLTYKNYDAITNQGLTQLTIQSTNGSDASASGYANIYGYPINVDSSYSISSSGALEINGSITRGLGFDVYGPSVIPSGIQTFNITTPSLFNAGGWLAPQVIQLTDVPSFSGALLSTTQTGTAQYYSSPNISYSFGTTSQDFSFSGVEVGSPGAAYELYSRDVTAINSTVVSDTQSLAGQTFGIPTSMPGVGISLQGGLGNSARALLGRGPGATKAVLAGGP